MHSPRRKLGVTTDVDNSWETWGSRISGIQAIVDNNAHASFPPSKSCADKINTIKQTRKYSLAELLSPPSRIFD